MGDGRYKNDRKKNVNLRSRIMKFISYGEEGKEKKGIIEEDGKIRDMQENVRDMQGEEIEKDEMEKIGEMDVNQMKKVEGNKRIGN